MPSPPSFSWRSLGLVMAGGMIGVAARAALLWALEPVDGPMAAPVSIAAVNVVGAFALGVVVGALGARHPSARSFLGTGILGGFTTYSTFAVQLATLPGEAPWAAVLIGLFFLVVGFFAAGLGVVLGRAMSHRAAGADEPGEAE